MNVGSDNKVQIMVRPFFTTFPPASGYTGVEVLSVNTDVVSQGWAYVYSFNNLFVNSYMNNKYFPNTLFHLLVCHGADPDAQNDMIQSLLDRGVGCYTGWTKMQAPLTVTRLPFSSSKYCARQARTLPIPLQILYRK